MTKARQPSLILLSSVVLLLTFSAFGKDMAATNLVSTSSAEIQTNDWKSVAAVYAQQQAQIQEIILSLEKNRNASEARAAASSKAVLDHLRALEESLAMQRASDLQKAQDANRTLVVVLVGFAAICCLAIVLAAYLQWRGMKRLEMVSSALMIGNGQASLRAVTAIGTGEGAPGVVEQSSARLSAAVARLESQIKELEQTPRLPMNDPIAEAVTPVLSRADEILVTQLVAPEPMVRSVPVTTVSDEAVLNHEKLDEAVAHFDQLLAKNPNNAEVLVKKGSALEQLHRLKEALECYDRAIALDSSITLP